MTALIDKIFDKMSLMEVTFRLPNKPAVDAIKRRINTLDQLKDIFNIQNRMVVKHPEIRKHVNAIIASTSVDDLLDSMDASEHPKLFSWLDQENSNRIMEDGRDKLTIEFMFNLTKSDDLSGMEDILGRILALPTPKMSKICSVLNKIDKKYFLQLVEKVVSDKREYVRTSILATNSNSFSLLTDTHKMIAIKALGRVPSSCETPQGVQAIDFKLFKSLKPLERIMALDKYLDYFPKGKKIRVFDPAPTEDEFKLILFAGCFEYNDLVEKMIEKYRDITENVENEK